MGIVSIVSSIVTMFTFGLYLVGRIHLIKDNKEVIACECTVDYFEYSKGNLYDEIVIEHNDHNRMQYLQSDITLRDIQFYEMLENGSEQLKETYKLLPKNQILGIEVLIPEGAPKYKIKFERADYVRGEMILSYNGIGYTKYNHNRAKYTFPMKSYWYYLFKY